MLCIDTSVSIEMTTKSVALYMANTATNQECAYHLINFSTNISSLDLTKNADVLVASCFEFAKINLSKDEAHGARFYGLNLGFKKAKDEFFDEMIDYEQI